MSEETYTLAEAQRELRRRQCSERGHDWAFQPRRLRDEAPTGIVCEVCGWTGSVTMDAKP